MLDIILYSIYHIIYLLLFWDQTTYQIFFLYKMVLLDVNKIYKLPKVYIKNYRPYRRSAIDINVLWLKPVYLFF